MVKEAVEEAKAKAAEEAEAEKKETVQEPVKKAFGYGISASAKRLIRQNHLSVDDIFPVNGKRIMEEDVVAYMEKAKTKATLQSRRARQSPGIK